MDTVQLFNHQLDTLVVVTEKSGIPTADTCDMIKHVTEKCPNLNFKGLMTIGSYDHDYSTGPNPDFIVSVSATQK